MSASGDRRDPARALGTILLDGPPVPSGKDYVAAGGGDALRAALARDPLDLIEEVKRSGLRGRGGAGFPTGVKWESVRSAARDRPAVRYAVCNAAEGEPGTFKDRWLLRHDPYQVIEGLAIAAHAVGAAKAYIGIKAAFRPEAEGLRRAMVEMEELGILGPVPVELVEGPDEYLFGEETGLLEVLEGAGPLPRILPPYVEGLFARQRSTNPTLVNNVETLANVPHIVRNGADWFRTYGTETSPGTMVFTLTGDVRSPGVYELPLGLPLRDLVFGIGGGPPEGRALKCVFPGAANTILVEEQLDTPLDFDAMKEVGSGLGSGGFVVYDDSSCIVQLTLIYSRFLYVESCAQCPACKFGAGEITSLLERIERGEGADVDLETMLRRSLTVTDGQRCYLPTGESLIVQSALQLFGPEFEEHLGRECPRRRPLQVPKIVDFDEERGAFLYDERYPRKRPDWTYAEPP